MQSINVRKLLLCTLLILTVVPAILSTIPSFQAKGAPAGGGPAGGQGGNQDRNHDVSVHLGQDSNSTTTMTT